MFCCEDRQKRKRAPLVIAEPFLQNGGAKISGKVIRTKCFDKKMTYDAYNSASMALRRSAKSAIRVRSSEP